MLALLKQLWSWAILDWSCLQVDADWHITSKLGSYYLQKLFDCGLHPIIIGWRKLQWFTSDHFQLKLTKNSPMKYQHGKGKNETGNIVELVWPKTKITGTSYVGCYKLRIFLIQFQIISKTSSTQIPCYLIMELSQNKISYCTLEVLQIILRVILEKYLPHPK